MKRNLAAVLALCMLLTSAAMLPSCTDDSSDGPQDQLTVANVAIVKDGQPAYSVVRSSLLDTSSDLMSAASSLKSKLQFACAEGNNVQSSTDERSTETKEILIGSTDRAESQQVISELAFNEYAIKVVGDKIVIAAKSNAATIQAIDYFIANYIPDGASTIEIAGDLSYKGVADFSTSNTHDVAYIDMAATVFDAYHDNHNDNGDLPGTWFWDAAEILEAYLDAYEQTGKPEYLQYAKDIARVKFGGSNVRTNWVKSNMYNDDIAWACIGFTRLATFTGDSTYMQIAQNNFDWMWERAYSPDVLGGGLWWKHDEQNTKNSCIQCPASIAACLIGKALNDDSYYEKAKELMEWEFENLFVAEGKDAGQVYDAKRTSGDLNKWASTYNQGTFVGACMLLHEKYGDQKYLDYADMAVEYGTTKLGGTTSNGILNGEDSGNDLPGFKGILTRWFYRYAKYTEDLDLLAWLQNNADTAYGNRNSKNEIWTKWAEKTQDNQDYGTWGLSAAVALLHNCEQWW